MRPNELGLNGPKWAWANGPKWAQRPQRAANELFATHLLATQCLEMEGWFSYLFSKSILCATCTLYLQIRMWFLTHTGPDLRDVWQSMDSQTGVVNHMINAASTNMIIVIYINFNNSPWCIYIYIWFPPDPFNSHIKIYQSPHNNTVSINYTDPAPKLSLDTILFLQHGPLPWMHAYHQARLIG